MEKKILLVWPGRHFKATKPELPYPLLHLSNMLVKNGFRCQILDMRIHPYKDVDLDDALCVGISLLTGSSMIRYALEFASMVRSRNPDIPLIWGGVHPTMLPEETARNEYVDIVVRGDGEITLLELARAINRDRPISAVKGITYKQGNRIIHNPDREPLDLNSLPIEIPYDLIELNKYEFAPFPVHTSRGCPHKCTFCYNLFYHKGQRWRCKTAERVLDEVEFVTKKLHVKNISFTWEDNFFVDKKRIEKICKGIIKRKLNIRWESFCRFDYASRFEDEFFKLLEESGCNLLSFGAESGSQRVLDNIIQKGLKVDQILEATRKIAKTNIKQITSFMCGVPGETLEDLEKTFNLIDELVKINPNISINGIFFYTPYPGTALFDNVVNNHHFKHPKTLEEWQRYRAYRDVECTWLDKEFAKICQNVSKITRVPFYKDNISFKPQDLPEKYQGFGYRQIYQFFSRLARFRYKHRIFSLPVEWEILENVMDWIRGYY